MTRSFRLGCATLFVLVLAGCGSPELWARYQAERALWQARRLTDRTQINPRLASDADLARAEEAFARIARRWPAATWTRPEHLGSRYGAEVARLSGEAAVAAARVTEARGQLEPALAQYEQVQHDYALVMPIRLAASIARAAALEQAGDSRLETAYEQLARDFPLVDPSKRQALEPVLGAQLRLAQMHRAAGRTAAADSALRASQARIEMELGAVRGTRAAPALWLALAQLHAARGGAEELGPALAALRGAVAEPEAKLQRPQVALLLGEYALAGGARDTALAYAHWAESLDHGKVAPDAILLAARVWEQFGVVDSAIATYSRFVDDFPTSLDPGSVARFHRAVLYEETGRWEQARSEYRALAAFNPSHDLALQSYEQIVAHHLKHGQHELAVMEGRGGITRLEQLIATYHDEAILQKAREARARLFLAIEDYPGALDALSDLWQRYPSTRSGALAGLEAARVAETNLHERDRAAELYRDVEQRSVDPVVQLRARLESRRLSGVGG